MQELTAPPAATTVEQPPEHARPHRPYAFYVFFTLYILVVLGALLLGLLANLGGLLPGVAAVFDGFAGRGWEALTRALVSAGEHTHHGGHVAFDYAFSAAFLAFGLFLVWLRPHEWTPRLLAVGLIGTAAAFNLESHVLYIEMTGTPVAALHFLLHGISGVAFLHALLLFPDGRLVPRLARWFTWAVYLVGAAATATLMVLIGGLDTVLPGTGGAADAETVHRILQIEAVFFVAFFGLLIPAVGATSQGWRVRTTPAEEARQQSRVLMWALAAAFVLALIVLGSLLALHGAGLTLERLHELEAWIFRVFPPLFAVIPIALLVGILRYRLWDVDTVVARTLTYGALAAFITATYVAIVVGVGRLVGLGEEPSLLLSIVATAVVAVAFEPVRRRAQQGANRLVYGHRATPYEVLSDLTGRLKEAVPTTELLARLARLLTEGTGAEHGGVWVRVGPGLQRVAAWPAELTEADEPAPQLDEAQLDSVADVGHAVPVRHQGELLGALTIAKPHGEALTPPEDKLVSDLAAHTGLVLRNARLTEELKARLEELRASRQRLVAAQDDERRRLERDLHDGAQQQLVAFKVQLGLARNLLGRGQTDAATGLLGELDAEIDDAVASLREVAHGIYPPLLAAEGLPTALGARAHRLPMPVEVVGAGTGRYPQDVEAAVYFCCVEALQNAIKYAEAAAVTVELSERDGTLCFRVSDDGRGFDPERTTPGMGLTNMADRLDALGGRLTLASAPGRGTTVSGEIKISPPATGAPSSGIMAEGL